MRMSRSLTLLNNDNMNPVTKFALNFAMDLANYNHSTTGNNWVHQISY